MRFKTEEEKARSKKGKDVLAKAAGIGAMFGASLGMFRGSNTSNSKALRTEEESNYYLRLAEYKRYLKRAKKEGNTDEVDRLNTIIKQLKSNNAEQGV
jgi:hypothetical protein